MATSKELLTNLADELRTLTNTTDKMGLSVMAEHVSDANTEVDEQSAVVDELMAALQGKSVPGAYETCTVTLSESEAGEPLIFTMLLDGEPTVRTSLFPILIQSIVPNIDVVVGSYLIWGSGSSVDLRYSVTTSGDCQCVTNHSVEADGSLFVTVPANTQGIIFKINGDCSITKEKDKAN